MDLTLKCTSRVQCEQKTRELGCRYSALLDLPYFDPVRTLVVDPMHNLFLGSAKRFTKILIAQEILSKADIKVVNERLHKIQIPVDIGRLPSKIDSGSTFTAEQWMNWTLYFSVFCLFGLLTVNQMECWRHFVLACRRLCKKSITESDITVADLLLLRFCHRFSEVFGSNF